MHLADNLTRERRAVSRAHEIKQCRGDKRAVSEWCPVLGLNGSRAREAVRPLVRLGVLLFECATDIKRRRRSSTVSCIMGVLIIKQGGARGPRTSSRTLYARGSDFMLI